MNERLNTSERIFQDVMNNDQVQSLGKAWDKAKQAEEDAYEALMQRTGMILKDRGIRQGGYVVGNDNGLYKIDDVDLYTIEESEDRLSFSLKCRYVLCFTPDFKKVKLGGKKLFRAFDTWRLAQESDVKSYKTFSGKQS